MDAQVASRLAGVAVLFSQADGLLFEFLGVRLALIHDDTSFLVDHTHLRCPGYWVNTILAGPIVALARDLFRYVYGRFDDPPRPAGELPPTNHEQAVPAAQRTPAARAERDAAP